MSQAKWLTSPASLSGRALNVWKRLAPALARRGALSADQAEQFAALCRLLAMAEAAASEIETAGLSFETKTGAKRPNPACAILLSAQRAAAPLMKTFGLHKRGALEFS